MDNFENGAVWHGFWHTGLTAGSFGSPGNPHYAARLGKPKETEHLPFFPFTSHKRSKCLLVLPPGELHCGRRDATSYLVPVRLVIKKNMLKKNFSFKACLGESYCQTALKNYKAILNARKMKKHGNG